MPVGGDDEGEATGNDIETGIVCGAGDGVMVLVSRPHAGGGEVTQIGNAVSPQAGVIQSAGVSRAGRVAAGIQLHEADIDAGRGICQLGESVVSKRYQVLAERARGHNRGLDA